MAKLAPIRHPGLPDIAGGEFMPLMFGLHVDAEKREVVLSIVLNTVKQTLLADADPLVRLPVMELGRVTFEEIAAKYAAATAPKV